ncbi:MAG: hypothetical protein KJ970_04935 [Candidatus Eisenbacteria bacterium]|uniref:Uncharacterized protein n=1 Tax=Eiseniibacteriota bacterium TaxID=2212470 RepID=A0A948RVD0_UNCEI|nr:hypothetical protein [Candidatus Eisenbacteria bacterium]MBU2690253.1 hypothetical protein [Candidatus Eisenbacteria bacterium]
MIRFWNALGAVAGVVAVVIAIFVFFNGQDKERKSLSIILQNRTTLLGSGMSNPQGGLRVMYDNRPIPNYAILQIRIANDGSQPIRGVDFEEPLTVELKDVAEILGVEQSAANPPDLRLDPMPLGSEILIQGALMNPGDWSQVNVAVVPTVNGVPGVSGVKGRVAGVNRLDCSEAIKIDSRKLDPLTSRLLMLLQVVMMLTVAALMFWRYRMQRGFQRIIEVERSDV